MGLLFFIIAWLVVGFLTVLIDHLVTGYKVSVGDLLLVTLFGPISTAAFLFFIIKNRRLLDKTVLKARGGES